MAKRKEESGPGTGLILVLVFFILASLVLGVTTYMGFNGQTELEKAAADAKADQKKAADNAAEQTLRRNVVRAALGTETPENRQELVGAPQAQQANILDEIKLINDQLGKAGAVPGKGSFTIPVGGGEGAAPAVAPAKTIPQIAKEWYKIAEDYKAKFDAAERARKTAESSLAASQAQQEKDKQAFEASVKALNETMVAKIKTMDAAFGNLKVEAEKAGQNFKKIEDTWAEEKARLEENLQVRLQDLAVERKRRMQAENPDPSDIGKRFERIDLAKLAERMGTITDKSGTFVTLNFSQKITLLPGQTFVVIPANTSLVEVIEREKGLEKVHHERVSLGPREPFTGNELIKGMVEVTDVTGPYAASARITHETHPIRSPLTRGDQIFNMTLSSGEKEHVAFAGIVDLDGDGRPDTDAFIRLLERNNLVVDSYLDLKTGEIRGKGMNSGTRLLILGTDVPVEVGRVKTMVKAARTNGTQLIDSRVFMSLIGVKPPRGATPPNYASVNLGAAEETPAAPKEGEPPMPPAEPKKEKE